MRYRYKRNQDVYWLSVFEDTLTVSVTHCKVTSQGIAKDNWGKEEPLYGLVRDNGSRTCSTDEMLYETEAQAWRAARVWLQNQCAKCHNRLHRLYETECEVEQHLLDMEDTYMKPKRKRKDSM